MIWYVLLLILALALKKREQEWILISVAIALPIAGIIGFGIFKSNEVCNICFWVIFLFLASFLLFEELYLKIFNYLKNLIKQLF